MAFLEARGWSIKPKLEAEWACPVSSMEPRRGNASCHTCCLKQRRGRIPWSPQSTSTSHQSVTLVKPSYKSADAKSWKSSQQRSGSHDIVQGKGPRMYLRANKLRSGRSRDVKNGDRYRYAWGEMCWGRGHTDKVV